MAMGRPMMMMGGRPMEEPRSLFGDALRTEDDPPMPMSLFQALGLPGFGRGPQQQRSMPMMQMQQQLFDGPFGFGERPQQVAQPMTLQSRPVSRPQPIAIQVELDEGESLEDAIQDAMLIDQVVRMITGAIYGAFSCPRTETPPPLPHLPSTPAFLPTPTPAWFG